MSEIPELKAVNREDGHGLKVYCDHCKKWHLHGHGLGHRAAHCTNRESPYMETGYILIGEVGENEKQI